MTDTATSVPVRVTGPDSLDYMLEAVHERIARQAHEYFTGRGGIHGHDLEDWLDAERELTIKPAAQVHAEGQDIFVEMVLPEIDLPNLTVHIAPSRIAISSDPDGDGLQLCQVIDLPNEVSLDGVDAEQLHNVLRVTAALVA
jgi:HSP20 family molecular chaperone IbpA